MSEMKEKAGLLDKALDMLIGDMDDMEGHGAMSHSLEECPDPLMCSEHDSELGDMAPEKEEPGSPAAVEVTVHKMGLPTMDGKSEKDESEEGGDHLTPEEAEELKKLLK